MIVFGTRLYGSIDHCGGTRIATQFVHVWFVPVFPIGSHVVLSEHGRQFRGIPLGLDGRSVLAAYTRFWGIAGAVGAFAGAAALAGDGDVPGAVVLGGLGALAAAASALGFLKLGKLTLDERGQRLAYGVHAGRTMDVARASQETRAGMYHAIHQKVVEQARGMASAGYRAAYDPATQWGAIALHPGVNDPGFLAATLTLARLEWAATAGAARAQYASMHDAIWRKLCAVDPRVLEAARSA